MTGKDFDSKLFLEHLIVAHEEKDDWYWQRFLTTELEVLFDWVEKANRLVNENEALRQEIEELRGKDDWLREETEVP